MNDYRKADGSVDWEAYRAAEVASGARCQRCGDLIVFSQGVPTTCVACRDIASDPGPVMHPKVIRCPKCGAVSVLANWDSGDYGGAKYEEGSHVVPCETCGCQYTIETHVSYSYTSPAREG